MSVIMDLLYLFELNSWLSSMRSCRKCVLLLHHSLHHIVILLVSTDEHCQHSPTLYADKAINHINSLYSHQRFSCMLPNLVIIIYFVVFYSFILIHRWIFLCLRIFNSIAMFTKVSKTKDQRSDLFFNSLLVIISFNKLSFIGICSELCYILSLKLVSV